MVAGQQQVANRPIGNRQAFRPPIAPDVKKPRSQGVWRGLAPIDIQVCKPVFPLEKHRHDARRPRVCQDTCVICAFAFMSMDKCGRLTKLFKTWTVATGAATLELIWG